MGNTIKHTHKINVLIVGATGKLGALVTRYALKQRNLSVTILVRDVEKSRDLVNEVKSAGGKVIQGDLSKPETLIDSTKGIHTIISTSAIYQDSDAEAHLNLLRDAVKNGVKRFVSSNYGINYEQATPGNVLIDAKLKVDREIAKTNIKLVSITTGFITDFFLPLNAQGLRYYGDINQKLDLTSYDDIAKVIVAIVARRKKSGTFSVRGEELSTKEIADIYNKVRGASIKPQSGGSIEELKLQVEQKKKEGDHINAAFMNLFELAYSGKGKIRKVDNDKFPKVKITSVEQFLTQNPAITIAADMSAKASQKISVLIIGASGKLGELVTRNALKNPNLTVTILVRDLNKAKDLVNEVKNAGGKVIQGDLSKPETLIDSTKGIHTVISCSAVYQDSDAEAQINLLNDAVKNGVKRFVSSNFGINYEYTTPGNVLIDAKLKFDRAVTKTNIKLISVTTGFITDFLLPMNAQGLRYYGDINQKLDLTTYDDIAKYVIAIVSDSEKSGVFNVRGEEISTKELAEVYNKVRGVAIKPQSGGSIEELSQQVEQKRKEGDHINAAFLNLFELAYSGKGKIQRIDNSQFPQVKPVSVAEFLKQNPTVTVA